VNTRENFWNVYCFATNQVREKTTKDNRQTAAWSCHDLTRNNELAVSGRFFLNKSSCLLVSNAERVLFLFQLEKVLFFKKPNYQTDL